MAELESQSARVQFTVVLGTTDGSTDTGAFSISDLNEGGVTADLLEGMYNVIYPLLDYSVTTIKYYTTQLLVLSEE